MALPDVWIGWLPWALAAGRQLVREDPVEVIYSTSPPATSHLIGWRLSVNLKKPWVADFRDPWFEEPPEPGAPSGLIYRRLDRALERSVVQNCSHVVTTTASLRDMLRARYPSLPRDKIDVIPNGYDENDFVHLCRFQESPHTHLRIVHAGALNPHFRDPGPLFDALRTAADAGQIDLNRVRLRFIGGGSYTDSPELRAAIAGAGLTHCVEFVARVPYVDSLRELAQADVLLLLQASEDTRGLVPAKLYEYLRMQKRVLALVLPGETSKILEATRGGTAIDPSDRARLTAEIGRLYAQWESGTLQRDTADLAVVRRFDRRELTRELAAVFARVVRANDPVSRSIDAERPGKIT